MPYTQTYNHSKMTTENYYPGIDDEDFGLYTTCPYCNREYDEIDYEYQICHFCYYNANDISDNKEE